MSTHELGLLLYIIVHREETGGSEKRKLIVDLAASFHRRRVENMVESARKNAEPRECE